MNVFIIIDIIKKICRIRHTNVLCGAKWSREPCREEGEEIYIQKEFNKSSDE